MVLVLSTGDAPGELADFHGVRGVSCDVQIICHADFKKPLSIVVHAATSFLSHGSILICVVTSQFSL